MKLWKENKICFVEGEIREGGQWGAESLGKSGNTWEFPDFLDHGGGRASLGT